MINLYNQTKSKEPNFKRLPLFKILYKQIGSGRQSGFIYVATHEKASDAEAARKNNEPEALSVEEIISQVSQAGARFFQSNESEEIDTVPDLLNYLENRNDYLGIYWSRAAVNTISSMYFANWHELSDRLKTGRIFSKNKEGGVIIPDAVELAGIFEIIDNEPPADWKTPGIFFKEGLTKSLDASNEENRAENIIRAERHKIINSAAKPSVALLKMIFLDIGTHVECFFKQENGVLNLEEYSSDQAKTRIKSWLDTSIKVCQMLKYFLVRESKAKGSPMDATLGNALGIILMDREHGFDRNWFDWYDAVRNFVTKKPQDGVKANKLKLNFSNSTLAA